MPQPTESSIDEPTQTANNLGKIEVVVLRCYAGPDETRLEASSEMAAESILAWSSSEEKKAVHFVDEGENLLDSKPDTPASSLFNEEPDEKFLSNAISGPASIPRQESDQQVTDSGRTEPTQLEPSSDSEHGISRAEPFEDRVEIDEKPVESDSHWLDGFVPQQPENSWQDTMFISTTPFFPCAKPVMVEDSSSQPVQDLDVKEPPSIPYHMDSNVCHQPHGLRNC